MNAATLGDRMGFWKRRRRDDDVIRLDRDVVIEVKDRHGRVLQSIDAAKMLSMVRVATSESSTRVISADDLDKQWPLLRPGAANATRFTAFRTNVVVASDAMDRGCAGMDAEIARRAMLEPGDEVQVRHEGRSMRMRLRFSDSLLTGEIELNPSDLVELGIDEGDTDYLEISKQEGPGCDQTSNGPPPAGVEKATTAYRVRVDSNGNPVEVSEIPAHAPKKGFRFWGQRVK